MKKPQGGTSLIPISQSYLVRPRINDLLEKSLQKPVTTIVAGAGYGKTQAVYAYLQNYDAVTIWLQLTVSDNLAIRLWENFTYAVSLRNKGLASKFKLLGFPETMSSYHRFVDLFSKETRDKKYVIVHDDCHLIHEKVILEFFNRIIDFHIPNLSAVFISRNKPRINTIKLSSEGILPSINEDDLHFTENELIQYFQMQDLQLSSKAIQDIYKYTGGWIFAIHLVELSLKKGLPHENYALSAAKKNIHRLIENEIFSIASDEMKYLLIKLSLIDQMPLGLLKELFSHDDALISEMTKISSFIRYDTYLNTYRIHHIFLSFLREKQNMLNTNDKIEFYNKAAEWYSKNGYGIDAITYYEKINRYDEIIKIIMENYSMCLPEETNIFMLGVLERASKAMNGGDTYIPDILRARFLMYNVKYEESFAELTVLKEKYKTQKNNTALCGVYVLMGFVCLFSGTNDFKKFFSLAHATGEKLDYSVPVMIGYSACKVMSSERGEFDRFIEALNESISPFTETLYGAGFGYTELAKAEYAFFRKDLKNAEKYARKAIINAQQKQQIYIEYMAIFYLIRIKVSLADYANAVSLLEEFKSQVKKQNSSICYGIYDIISGWFYSSIGHFDKVASWIKSDDYLNGDKKQKIYGWERLAQAKFRIIKKEYLEALAIIENLEDNSQVLRKLLGKIELKILKAISLYYSNDHDEAYLNLQLAYDLASPNSLVMPFIEQGNNMRTLAKAAILSKKCTIPTQWLEAILIKSASYSKRLLHIIAESQIPNHQENSMYVSLSKRETEVLTDLCHGLTREEIADNCNLSINTVKSMLRSIYSKLGALNTSDAIRIALSMRIIK